MTTPSSNTPAASTQAVPADALPSAAQTARWMFDPKIVKPALADSFRKLSPRVQWRNPVMFVVYLGSILTTLLFIQAVTGKGEARLASSSPSLWLWFTVLFANFAEALAEGRSKAQAAALRGVKKSVMAKLRSDRARGGVAAAAAQCGASKAAACARVTWCWSKRAIRCPPTAT
jgi:K+-transporting ATPase ATPase B chain